MCIYCASSFYASSIAIARVVVFSLYISDVHNFDVRILLIYLYVHVYTFKEFFLKDEVVDLEVYI